MSNLSFGINFKHRCFICHSLQSTGGCRPGPSLDCIGELCATGAHVLRAQTGGRCGPESRCDDSFESFSAPADQPSHFWGFKQPLSYNYHQLSIMKPTLDHYPSTISHINHISHPLTQTCAPDPMVKLFNPQPCRSQEKVIWGHGAATMNFSGAEPGLLQKAWEKFFPGAEAYRF